MQDFTRGLSLWHKTPEILIFGFLSAIFGILLVIAGFAVGAVASRYYGGNLWPFVALLGSIISITGFGFALGKSWGYIGSVLAYSIAYSWAIVQAFQKSFVSGMILDPIVLTFLIIPQVRSYFFQPRPINSGLLSQIGSPPTTSIDTDINVIAQHSQPTLREQKTRLLKSLNKPSNILTLVLMIGILLITPGVATAVHTVYVTGVSLNIVYPTSASTQQNFFPWFGFSPKTISGPVTTWGGGRFAVTFDLYNLGLFQSHTINSLRPVTPGFTMIFSGLSGPLTLSDLEGVTFHLIIQGPDRDYSGPLVLEIQTT